MLIFIAVSAQAASADSMPSASPSPSPPPGLNPFCDVTLAAAPWDANANLPTSTGASDALRLYLYAQRGSSLEADVTFVSAESVYGVHIQKLNLSGEPYKRWAEPVLVTLPQSTAILYAYVSSYVIDGGQQMSCPIVVRAVGVWELTGPTHFEPTDRVASATLLRALPSLPCGKLYENARYLGGGKVSVASYITQPVDVPVDIYLDSKGNLVQATLSSPTGIEDIDNAAVGSAELARFAPAQFLCQPVVSHYLYTFRYAP
jgi:hypothetical protein